MKKFLPLIIGIFLLMGIFIYIQPHAEKSSNWTPTFSHKDKIPYGTFLFFHLLRESFWGQRIGVTDKPIDLLVHDSDNLKYVACNYILFARRFQPYANDITEILNLANSGNNIFVLADEYGEGILDTLAISINNHNTPGVDTLENEFYLEDTRFFQRKGYKYRNNMCGAYFSYYDSSSTSILGYDSKNMPNFIRIKRGKGAIFLHSSPISFTNYYIADTSTRTYPFLCLSYLPQRTVIWNDNYMYHLNSEGRRTRVERNEISTSELSFLLANESLRWAFWILILGLILYVIFEGKRKQRIITVTDPFRNTTLEFAETLGRLYYETGDHKNVAEKKILYFYDFLRTKLNLRTDKMDEEFYQRFSEKSGMNWEETAALFAHINRARTIAIVDEEDLLKLNRAIDQFYIKISK